MPDKSKHPQWENEEQQVGEDQRKLNTDSSGTGGPSIAGSPGVSEGGTVNREDILAEEREAADKTFGEPTGERGDLGDSGPGED